MHIYERYQDSAAAVFHNQRFVENFGARFLSLCTPTRMSVYGDTSDELRTVLTDFNPRYLGLWQATSGVSSRDRLSRPVA